MNYDEFENLEAKEVQTQSRNKIADSDNGYIYEGRRNIHLASVAGTMKRKDMSRQAIEAALLEDNRQRSKPPLEDIEVKRIALLRI